MERKAIDSEWIKSVLSVGEISSEMTERAHRLVAPRGRIISPTEWQKQQAMPAAVLILLFPYLNCEEDIRLLLIKRKVYPGVHSGQISFPGGKKEHADVTLWDTAVREAEEEIGIERKEIEQLRTLAPIYIPPSNFLVMPYVAWSSKQPLLAPNQKEVELLLMPSLAYLMRLPVEQALVRLSTGEEAEVPCFRYQEHIVWGATAMMLSELLLILRHFY